MPLLHTYPEFGPLERQFVTKSGAISLQVYPPNLLCISYHKIHADRATIDEFFPVMEEWGLALPDLIMMQDLREGDDISLDNRLYIGKRFTNTALNQHGKGLALLTASTYQRVILAGVLAIAPPPVPYIATTSEADAIRFLLSQSGKKPSK